MTNRPPLPIDRTTRLIIALGTVATVCAALMPKAHAADSVVCRLAAEHGSIAAPIVAALAAVGAVYLVAGIVRAVADGRRARAREAARRSIPEGRMIYAGSTKRERADRREWTGGDFR